MKHSKDNPKQDGSPSRRRFFEILDRLAGIEGWENVSDEQFVREAQEAEPVPVSPEQIEEAVARWRALKAAAATPKRRPRWWRRPAAVIPMMVLVLLGAATPVYLVWSGRNSTRELAYEDALQVVFDRAYPIGSRQSAQSRVLSSMLRGITVINRCRGKPGPLAAEAERVVRTLRTLVAVPLSTTHALSTGLGGYERVLLTLSDRDRSSVERIGALRKVEEAIRAGVSVLERARGLGPPFERNSRVAFAQIARRLAAEPVKTKR